MNGENRMSPLVMLCWTTVVLCQSVHTLTATGSDCAWSTEIVNTTDLQQNVSSLQHSALMQNIDQLMTSLDVKNLQMALQNADSPASFYAFPYTLKIRIICDIETSALVARSFATSGGYPVVHLCYIQLQSVTNSSQVCKKLIAQPLEETGWSQDSCPHCIDSVSEDLAWFVPLPRHNASIAVHTMIQSSGLGGIIQDARFSINTAGYEGLASSSSAAVSSASKVQRISRIPGVSPLFALSGLSDSDAHLLSDTEFLTFDIFEPSLPAAPVQCSCAEMSDITQIVVSLVDRVLLIDTRGVFEILAEFSDHFSTNIQQAPTLSLPNCIKHVAEPSHLPSGQQYVAMVGACADDGKLFLSSVLSTNETGLLSIQTVSRQSFCADLSDVLSCSVLDVASSELSWGTVYFLLDVTFLSGTSVYGLLAYEVPSSGDLESGNWTLLSTIPQEVPVTSPTESFPVSLLDQLTRPRTGLTLTGISLTSRISSHVYLWGNRILHSFDAGRTLYLLPTELEASVEILTINTDDLLVFVTNDTQIWAGSTGGTSLWQIYPTATWNLVHDLAAAAGSSGLWDGKILTAFFDSQDRLQLLTGVDTASLSSIARHTVPLTAILHELAAAHQLQEAAAAASPKSVAADVTNFLSLSSSTGLPVKGPCPFSHVVLEMPPLLQYTRLEIYSYVPPAHVCESPLHCHSSLLAYHAVVQNMDDHYKQQFRSYADWYSNHANRWRDSLNTLQHYHQYLFQTRRISSGLHVDLDHYHRSYRDYTEGLPKVIYLGRNSNLTFNLYLITEDNFDVEDLQSIQLSSLVSDTTLLNVILERKVFSFNNTIKYQVTITDTGVYQVQQIPGLHLYPVSVDLGILGSSLKCMDGATKKNQGEYHSTVMLGCPPAQRVMFDWQAARQAVQDKMDYAADCEPKDPERFCFYFQNGFYPFFVILDEATGQFSRVMGRYTVKVIGGSATGADSIKLYTNEEIRDYNSMESESGALVWSSAGSAAELHSGIPVYTYDDNGIRWLCQPNSPCANIMPTFPFSPEFYFLVQFSNKEVDLGASNCDYTFTFIVHIHGLPVHAIKMTLVLVMTTMLFLGVHAAIYFACYRQDKALWTRVKTALIVYFGRKVQPKLSSSSTSKGEGDHPAAKGESRGRQTWWRSRSPRQGLVEEGLPVIPSSGSGSPYDSDPDEEEILHSQMFSTAVSRLPGAQQDSSTADSSQVTRSEGDRIEIKTPESMDFIERMLQ